MFCQASYRRCYNFKDSRNRTLKTVYRPYFKLPRLQPTQNPFRDWNISSAALVATAAGFALQPTQNPFRDWNDEDPTRSRVINLASTNPKPFQGLKQGSEYILPLVPDRLQPTQNPFRDWNVCPIFSYGTDAPLQPTQNPFRDWNTDQSVNRLKGTGFNQPKTLSGIETLNMSGMPYEPSTASTNPKPFQGLKHNHARCKGAIVSLQPTQNPFRDWNFRLPLPSSCSPLLQPTQNPFRDWNKLVFNTMPLTDELQPTQNPFRDWNRQ